MKAFTQFAFAAVVAVGGLTFTGCADQNSPPADQHSTTSGGNGAFGENASKPGSYHTDGQTSANPSDSR